MRLKWLWWLGALVFAGAAAVTALLLFVRHKYPPEKLKQELEAALTSRSGFETTINDLDYTWSGDIRLTGVCLKPRLFVTSRCFLSADNLRLSVSLLSLIRKRPEIRSVRADRLRVALFADTALPARGKERHTSWQRPAAPLAHESAGAQAALRIGRVEIEAGEVEQDIPALPLAGRHTFAVQVTGEDKRHIRLTGHIAGQGGFQANADVRGAEFAGLIAALREKKLPAALAVQGEIVLKALNLGALDRRFGRADGRIPFERAGEQIIFSPENLSVEVSAPAMKIQLSGRFPLALPDLSVVGAQGSVLNAGMNLQFNTLSFSRTKPVNAALHMTGDVKTLAAPRNVAGNITADGNIENGSIRAQLSIRDFAMPAGRHLLSASVFSAQLTDDVLSFKSQNFAWGKNSFSASAEIVRRAGKTSIRGAANFADVEIETAGEQGTAGQGEREATGVELALRIAARNIRYGKWQAHDVAAQVSLNDAGLSVENAAFTLARGRVNFSYRTRSATHQLRFSMNGVKAEEISRTLEWKATVFGALNAQGSLEWSGQGGEAVRKSISGQLAGSLGRGKIRDGFFQKGILTGPLNRLEDKFQDIEFASAEFSAQAKNGFIDLRRAYFDAEEWNLALRAESDAEGQGKAALTFRFKSRFVENVASPLHLGISSRLDGEFYDLPFACRGKIFTAACYKQNW